MSLFLGSRSAIEYLKTHGTHEDAAPHARAFKTTAPTRAEVGRALAGSLVGMDQPLELVVPAKGCVRGPNTDPDVSRRHWGCALPPDAFVVIDAGAGIYASTPGFAFAQAAKRLSLIELMKLGYEICGSYFVSSSVPAGFYPCEAVTTPERLRHVLQRLEGFDGRRKAAQALGYVVGGSASPQETRLVLILCLPCRYGGYGLPFPALNRTVVPRASDAPFTSQRSYVCDLYWEKARLDVEYDSDQFHAGAEKLALDARRRSELALLGVQVISVTRKQLGSERETEKVARAIARVLGVQIRTSRVEGWRYRHQALRRELFGDFGLR